MSAESVEVGCTRKWFTVNPDCTCGPCTATRNREQKLIRLGKGRPNLTVQAWAALDRMLASGRQPCEIAATAGVPKSGILQMLQKRKVTRETPRVGWVRANRLIAAEGKPPAGGRVSVFRAQRRLQAMACMGWSLRSISEATGVDVSTLCLIRSGKIRFTAAEHSAAVFAWYGQASVVRRNDHGVAASARKAGWAPPAAWDNIDDPDEHPKGLGGTPHRRDTPRYVTRTCVGAVQAVPGVTGPSEGSEGSTGRPGGAS